MTHTSTPTRRPTAATRRTAGVAVALCALVAAGCSGGVVGSADEWADGAATDPTAATEAAPVTVAEPTEPSVWAPEQGDAGGYDWSDERRRKAVSMAIDREAITTNIFQGGFSPADDWWPSSFPGYRGGDTCANLQYNPEEAKRLWEEAGGTTGPVTFWFNSGSIHDEWVEAVSNMVKANLGVEEVSFQSLEFADYLDKIQAGEIDGPFRYGWLMDYPSPGNFLTPIYGTEGSSNRTGYSNPAFDAAAGAGDSKSLTESIGDYQMAADILCDDMPVAPMFFGLFQGVHGENVANVEFNMFQTLNVTKVEDLDGDGAVSMYVCEPQNGLFGQMSNETCGSEVISSLFKGLWSLDEESYEPVFDGVAESVETTDGGSTWTIKLKQDWTFHDGSPVTAKSFVDAWNWAALGTNGANNQFFIKLLKIKGFDAMNPPDDNGDSVPDTEPATALEGVTMPDDYTIEVALDAPFPQLPLVMVYKAFNPLPEAFFDDPEGFGEAPIGNGPFMMDGTWEHDVQVATKAYDGYAGERPNVDAIVYKIYSEVETGYNDVRAGNLDIIDMIPSPEMGTFKTEFDGRYIAEPTASFNYLAFPVNPDLVASWNE